MKNYSMSNGAGSDHKHYPQIVLPGVVAVRFRYDNGVSITWPSYDDDGQDGNWTVWNGSSILAIKPSFSAAHSAALACVDVLKDAEKAYAKLDKVIAEGVAAKSRSGRKPSRRRRGKSRSASK